MIRAGKLNRICKDLMRDHDISGLFVCVCVIRMYPGFILLCKFCRKDLIIFEHNSNVGVVWRSPGNVGIFLEFLQNNHVFDCFFFHGQDTHTKKKKKA